PDRPQGKCGRGSSGDHRSLPHFRKGPRCLRSPVPPGVSSRQQNRFGPASGPQCPDHGKYRKAPTGRAEPMKWLLLLGVAIFLIVRARRRRGDPPAAGRFGVLAAFAVLAACIALLTAVLK